MAGSATSAFNQLSQYASSPGHRTAVSYETKLIGKMG